MTEKMNLCPQDAEHQSDESHKMIDFALQRQETGRADDISSNGLVGDDLIIM